MPYSTKKQGFRKGQNTPLPVGGNGIKRATALSRPSLPLSKAERREFFSAAPPPFSGAMTGRFNLELDNNYFYILYFQLILKV